MRCALLLVLLMLAAPSGTARAAVEVSGDACGLATTLPRALIRRGVSGRDLDVRVRIDERRIRLRVQDGGGPVIERVMPRSPSCAADLDLLVLIVERQRREIGLGPEEPEPIETSPRDAPGPEPDEAPTERHLELGFRGGSELGDRIRGDLELLGRLELGRFWEVQAGLRFVLPATADVAGSGGALDVWAFGSWAGGGVGLVTGDARLFAAGLVGVEHVRASASDALFQRTDSGAWTVVLAIEGRYERAVWDDLVWLSIGLGGRFRSGAPVFAVEGSPSTFEVPSATLVARVGVWARFF